MKCVVYSSPVDISENICIFVSWEWIKRTSYTVPIARLYDVIIVNEKTIFFAISNERYILPTAVYFRYNKCCRFFRSARKWWNLVSNLSDFFVINDIASGVLCWQQLCVCFVLSIYVHKIRRRLKSIEYLEKYDLKRCCAMHKNCNSSDICLLCMTNIACACVAAAAFHIPFIIFDYTFNTSTTVSF